VIAGALSLVPLAAWIYLLLGRGGFWRAAERDDRFAAPEAEIAALPAVAVVIPARDEAETIGSCVGSLLRQDYRGSLMVMLVDDQSADETAARAAAAANDAPAGARLHIVAGTNPPAGWTGKLWAMRQGLAAVEAAPEPPSFVLFSDADIRYAPHALSRLVAIALAKKSVLTSLMVRLNCESAAERWLVPAFVFFFQMLYPFAWVNDPRKRTAAAAGGCMLAKREALRAAGGLEAISAALIDDCALAGAMKRQGPIWLGLTEDVESLRPYPDLADFRRMVVRSAFAELRYSLLRLVAAVGGMALVYLAPVAFALAFGGVPRIAGGLAWALMVVAQAPTLRLYRRPLPAGCALPAVAAAYVAFTIESSILYWRGRGGYWKGRFQAPAQEARRE